MITSTNNRSATHFRPLSHLLRPLAAYSPSIFHIFYLALISCSFYYGSESPSRCDISRLEECRLARDENKALRRQSSRYGDTRALQIDSTYETEVCRPTVTISDIGTEAEAPGTRFAFGIAQRRGVVTENRVRHTKYSDCSNVSPDRHRPNSITITLDPLPIRDPLLLILSIPEGSQTPVDLNTSLRFPTSNAQVMYSTQREAASGVSYTETLNKPHSLH